MCTPQGPFRPVASGTPLAGGSAGRGAGSGTPQGFFTPMFMVEPFAHEAASPHIVGLENALTKFRCRTAPYIYIVAQAENFLRSEILRIDVETGRQSSDDSLMRKTAEPKLLTSSLWRSF